VLLRAIAVCAAVIFTADLKKSEIMSDEILRYTDMAALIQMAKARGWSDERIVREISTGLPHAEALNLARRAAPLLDLTISEFMRLRKNE
jgi:hypothetical protein